MRRIAALALALLLLSAAACAESYVVGLGEYEWIVARDGGSAGGPYLSVIDLGGGRYAVAPRDMISYAGERMVDSWEDEDGEVYTWVTYENDVVFALADDQGRFLTDYIYDNIYSCETAGCFLGIRGDGSTALLDDQGRLLTDFIYEDIYSCETPGCLLGIRGDGSTDLLNGEGNVIRTLPLRQLAPVGGGTFLGYQGEPDAEGYVDILRADAEGRITPTGLRAEYWLFPDLFSEGLWTVAEPGTGVWQCLDEELDVRFTLPCLYIDQFRDGLACFMGVDEYYGAVDREGNIVLPAEYDSVIPGGDHVLGIREGKAYLCAADGSGLAPVPGVTEEVFWGSFLQDGGLLLETEERSCLFSAEGELIAELPLEGCGILYADLGYELIPDRFTVSRGEWPDGTMDLVDVAGNVIRSGDAWIECVGRWGEETLYIFGSHVRDRVLYGLCDDSGRELLPARYNLLTPLARDRFWAVLGTEYRLIDAEGNTLLTLSELSALSD